MKLVLAFCVIVWSMLYGLTGQASPDFRLVDVIGRETSSSGRLEYLLDSTWHSVCFIHFELQEADAACEALGFLYALNYFSVRLRSISSPTESPRQPSVGLSCSFSSVETCTVEILDCNNGQEVQLICTNEVTPMRLASSGSNPSVGLVEVFINGIWGTVCSSNFGLVEANIVCRQLGFEGADAYSSVSNLQYQEVSSTVPVWLTGISCGRLFQLFRRSGQVLDNIRLCPHTNLSYVICNHSTDAIVSCVKSGALRLVVPNRGTNNIRHSGRLEIYQNGIWGRVCSRDLTDLTAMVACRQLGFATVDCYGSLSDLGIELDNSDTPIPVLISDVKCNALASSLLLCSYTNGSSGCVLNEDDVALSCYSTITAQRVTSSCSFSGSGGSGRLALPISLACVAVVVIVAIIIFVSLQLYCRRSCDLCSKYGRDPVRHEEAATATSDSTRTEVSPPAASTAASSSRGRHSFLRRNPNRARHHRLRHNGPRQEQPARTSSRRLHNWRHIRTNFQSREQESNQSGANISSENQEPGSFFVSYFGQPTRTEDNLNSTNINQETGVLAESMLQQMPPPSYETATEYPPAYCTRKQEETVEQEAPPYSDSTFNSAFINASSGSTPSSMQTEDGQCLNTEL